MIDVPGTFTAPVQPAHTTPLAGPAPVPFAMLRRVQRGALLLEAESPAEIVYLIQSGQVRVFRLRESGQETTTAVLGPGQLVGIAPLLGRPVYHAFAECLTTVEVWAMQADRLLEQLQDDPALLRAVFTALGHRLTLAQTLLRDIALLPVAERIPNLLPHLQACLGGEQPRLTRELLAGLIGARRETVSRALCGGRADVA